MPSGEDTLTINMTLSVEFFFTVTPWRFTSSGRLGSATDDPVLHLTDAMSEVGAGLEGDGEVHTCRRWRIPNCM